MVGNFLAKKFLSEMLVQHLLSASGSGPFEISGPDKKRPEKKS
jgi:hypothetical protein